MMRGKTYVGGILNLKWTSHRLMQSVAERKQTQAETNAKTDFVFLVKGCGRL